MARISGQSVALSFKNTGEEATIDFPGYSYKHEASPISGSSALVYDPDRPENWQVPFQAEVVPDVTVQAPGGGYIVPRSLADKLRPLLKLHNIRFETIDRPDSERNVEVFRATQVEQSKTSFEGRQTTKLDGSWATESQMILNGSLFVPVEQPEARLVIALLEPQALDSFAYWGFFNAYFEQREYMEWYVAEAEAKRMLEEDPEVAVEFNKRLAEDESFRNSPKARLSFFYERHPSWDTRMNLYPIYRVTQ